MLNRQLLRFRPHTRKLIRRIRLGKSNWRPFELKTHKHLVTWGQNDVHRRERSERHPSELSSHVKFSKLSRSLRLGFRTSELSTMTESGNIPERQTLARYRRPLAGTSGCSHPLQLLKQSKESSIRSFMPISVMKKKNEQLSSTLCSTGAHQHQSQQVQLSPDTYTSLGDKQEDAPGSGVAADGDDYDRDTEQRGTVIKLDDQCELASGACASLIIDKHADASGFNRTIALPVQLETDGREYRYGDSHRLSAWQGYVIVHSTWFDDAVQRECHLTNYESANQDSRQRPLTVSQQAISKQPTASTSGDNYRRLLYPCRQCIWSQYFLAFDVATFSSITANSSFTFRRKNWLQQLCSSPSVHSISSLSFEVVGTSSVASTTLTTKCSVGARAIGAMTNTTLDFVTTAGCSGTAESSINVHSSSEMASLPRNTAVICTVDIVCRNVVNDTSRRVDYSDRTCTKHYTVTSNKADTRCRDPHDKLASTTSSKIPAEDCLQPTDDASSVDEEMSYTASTTSIVSISDEKCLVAKVLSPPVTDRKTSVVKKEECDAEASTSPFSVIVAKCSKNQRNKVRYGYVRRHKKRQKCQPTKRLPKKRHKESPTYRQYYSMIQQVHDNMKEIYTSCKSSQEECRKMMANIQRLLHQNWIEQFWQLRILQQIGIQISQSEHSATVLLSHAQQPNHMASKTTHEQKDYSYASEPGSVKSTKLSTESARSQSSSLESAPGLAKGYKKPQSQLPSFIQSQNVRGCASKRTYTKLDSTSPRSSKSSSFQNFSTTNSSFQNYMHRLPAVRMARTKQTARKSRDDRQEEDRRRDRDRSDSPPRRGRGRSPLPQKYVCVFCRKVNNQRTNHKRHLVMQHSCRLDGTPATEADFAQARRWSAKEPTGRSSRYKTQEFVESDSNDDTTQATGASTPSRSGSPSPPRGRRSKRTRSESSGSPSPRRAASPRRGGSQ